MARQGTLTLAVVYPAAMRNATHRLERALLVRGLRNWLLFRVMAAALLLIWGLAGEGGSILGSPGSALLIPIVGITATLLEARRRGEMIFLANMGISLRRLVVLFAVPAFLGELGLLVSFGR